MMMLMHSQASVVPTAVPFDNRILDNNQLSALDVGLFDKNPALTFLYVDQGLREGSENVGMVNGNRMQRGGLLARHNAMSGFAKEGALRSRPPDLVTNFTFYLSC